MWTHGRTEVNHVGVQTVVRSLLLLLGATVLGGGSCEPELLQNPGFDLWCGERLCGWTVEQGEVRRVATWHRSDHGAALEGDPVRLSQVAEVDSGDVDCIGFDLLADIDEDATVFLELDFLADGSIEYSHPVATGHWTRIRYEITPPAWYDGVRFILRKVGSGRAVLAEIHATDSDGCTGEPVLLQELPLAAPCSAPDECSSGFCSPVDHAAPFDGSWRNCAGCQSDQDCLAHQRCGLAAGPPSAGLYRACVAARSRGLGDRCAADGECATDLCCQGICSGCCEERPCAGEQRCASREATTLGEEYQFLSRPFQCEPGDRTGEVGAPCLFDDDCRTEQCGPPGGIELKLCALDGRRCGQDADCPLGYCLPLGRADATCR